ncbi:MAG: hypothetical protein U0521_24965 [Anaerolineae bacterium]
MRWKRPACAGRNRRAEVSYQLIGCGGIDSGASYRALTDAGARAVQY